LPFFDPTGRLTHRLTAARAHNQGAVRRFEDVEVVYFSPNEPDRVIQRVRATDAVWDDTHDTLTGDGAINAETADSTLAGEGFAFALATSVLKIERNFKLTNAGFVLTSDRAVADLLIEKTATAVKLRDVKRCEAIGHLHVVSRGAARAKFHFDEAFSEKAIYAGQEKTLSFPNPVRTLSGKVESVSKTVFIDLKDAPKLGK
jgi:hypothetical protein